MKYNFRLFLKWQFLGLLICLIASEEVFAFVVDAGEDRVVCMGGSTTLGGNPTAQNPDNSNMTFTYSWQPTGDLSCSDCPNPVLSNINESMDYTITVVDEGGFTCTETVRVEATSVSALEVNFSGEHNHTIVKDDGEVEYTAPHWRDNSIPLDGDADDIPTDIKHPICYESGKSLVVSAKFKVHELTVPFTARVRAACSDGIHLPIKTAVYNLATQTIDLSNVVSTPLASSKVNYYNPFEIQWEISFDGGSTWCSAGVTKNPLYVTLGKPIQPYTPPTIPGETAFEEVKLFHTLVHHGCTNAKDVTSLTQVLNNVWQDFTDREVRRVDGTQMTYYANYQCTSTTTNTILETGDGQCGSWSRLFLDILKAQGIDYQNEYIIIGVDPNVTNGSRILFIKEWIFNANGGTSGDSNLPFLNTFLGGDPPISNNTYNWTYAEVNDMEGESGQGTPNPASIFGNHQIVLINGTYYDPSYGQNYSSLLDFDVIAIDAFVQLVIMGNEKSYLIKKNESTTGQNVFENKYNY